MSFHFVETIDVETLNRHGFMDVSDEVWISDSKILKILRKHGDLEQIILDDSTLIQSINSLIKGYAHNLL